MLTRSGTSTPPFTSPNLHAPAQSLSCVQLFMIPWTVVHQAPLSMGFSRQEYRSGLPFPSPGHPPDPEIKFGSPALQEDSLPSEAPGKPRGTITMPSDEVVGTLQ